MSKFKNKNKKKNKQRISLTPLKRRIIACKHDWKCAMCKESLDAMFHIDHIIPLCFNGSNNMSNLQPLCGNCHLRKTSIEIQIYYDRKREKRTGKSRYFDPIAVEYLGRR